jgi:ribosomal protein S18 acetylase RimI-like enzyme
VRTAFCLARWTNRIDENGLNMRTITATIDDLELIVPLFDAYRVFYGKPSDQAAARAFLQERFLLREGVIFLAIEDKSVLGFTQLYPSFSSVSMQRMWILNDLFVIPEARGQRVGEQLIERALQHARDSKAKGVMLETAHSNTSGQKLYERLGFEREDLEFRTYFKSV